MIVLTFSGFSCSLSIGKMHWALGHDTRSISRPFVQTKKTEGLILLHAEEWKCHKSALSCCLDRHQSCEISHITSSFWDSVSQVHVQAQAPHLTTFLGTPDSSDLRTSNPALLSATWVQMF